MRHRDLGRCNRIRLVVDHEGGKRSYRYLVGLLVVAAAVVLAAPAAGAAPASLRVVPMGSSVAATSELVAGQSVASLQAPASPAVHIAPGLSPGGYIPLDQFGTIPIAIGDEQIVNFAVPQFVFNGATHTQIGVTSNGYIVVGGGTVADVDFEPLLGSPAAPNGVLAPFWTDLDGTGAPGILTNVLTDGVNSWIVVEWRLNVFGTSSRRTFQVWIGIDGVEDITYTYNPGALPADPAGFPFIVGVENLDGTSGASIPGLPTTDLRVTSDPAPDPEAEIADLMRTGDRPRAHRRHHHGSEQQAR